MPEVRFTQDQVELLFDVVDASRESKEQFLMIRSTGGEWLQHPGFPQGRREFDYGDAVVLQESGFLTVTHWGDHGAFHFVPSPYGLQAYEDLHEQMGEPAEAVEDDQFRYLDSSGFKKMHPEAFERWNEAATLLRAKDATDKVTDIGHHCREAIQEFAESLLKRMRLEPEEQDKQKTKNRIAQALTHAKDKEKFGKSTKDILDAMFTYWDTTSDLIVKQEHGATKEGEELGWEDARAVVFQTMIVMYEFDRRIGR